MPPKRRNLKRPYGIPLGWHSEARTRSLGEIVPRPKSWAVCSHAVVCHPVRRSRLVSTCWSGSTAIDSSCRSFLQRLIVCLHGNGLVMLLHSQGSADRSVSVNNNLAQTPEPRGFVCVALQPRAARAAMCRLLSRGEAHPALPLLGAPTYPSSVQVLTP
jgi:hypothetical protein